MEDSEKKAYKSQSASSKESATLNMDYSHTEAHQMAYDFSLYLHKKMMKLPHYEKFTLQKEVRDTIDEMLDELEEYEKSKTISHLYKADRLKGRLVRKIRTCYDLRYSAINGNAYCYCSKQLGCIGACIGGLIKKAQEEKKNNK